MKNPTLGMTTQNLICEMYGITPTDKAKNQFDSVKDSEIAKKLKPVIKSIFKEIGEQPTVCTSFTKGLKSGETLLPFNFILTSGLTCNIMTNKSRSSGNMQAPKVVGQAGFSVINYFFGHLVKKEIKTKNDIKELIWNNSWDILPIMIDYLFIADVTVWLYNKNEKYEYLIIRREEKPEIDFTPKNISYTKDDISEWNNSLTIKYGGTSIAESQVFDTSRGLTFRLNMPNLVKFLKEKQINNETLGMSAEKVICDLYSLERPEHLNKRSSKTIEKQIEWALKEATEQLPMPIEHSGSTKGSRGGSSKSSFDFILEGKKTLSLKTNWGRKVCPPEVGQPSAATFTNYFKHLFPDREFTPELFKELCLTKTAEMMKIYMLHLLDSDYLLWLYKTKAGYEFEIVEKLNFNIEWEQSKFSFTRDIAQWTGSSSTVKYDGLTIGEFQVHSRRNSFVFRFDMQNLLKIIKKMDS